MELENITSFMSHLQHDQTSNEYTHIRVLGRGAFGEASLYRRHEDDCLVVWKEVNMDSLSHRQQEDAKAEIDILAMFNHPSIVGYFNHFSDGDKLLIEMEYANGGNLAEKISLQEESFNENVVMWYFYQLMSAVSHIHNCGILHRDIKGLNIFLTKTNLVKLGDFGISKVLETDSEMADTCVGTPYYMSPELIKGEKYNAKSDIWACGCLLYELLTLTRVFEATNALRLASVIVHCDVNEIKDYYTQDIRILLNKMLDKEPTNRPSAEQVLTSAIFSGGISHEIDKKIKQLNTSTRMARLVSQTSVLSSSDINPVVTSKTSEVYIWSGGKLPQVIEKFNKSNTALQISAGKSHLAVITIEKELFTWINSHGGCSNLTPARLGHSDNAHYKSPKRVEYFLQHGIALKKVKCGSEFTICLSDEGEIYTFGSDYYGCLGNNQQFDGDDIFTPTRIESFGCGKNLKIKSIACGENHCIALTCNGDVYTWGSGEFGRLGHGDEDDIYKPKKVELKGNLELRSIHAGGDTSFLVQVNGRVLACGSNEYNKLGANSIAKGLLKTKKQVCYDIPYQSIFSVIKPLSKHNIISVSPGKFHTAVINNLSQLYTFGSNKYGELGVGDVKCRFGVNRVAGILLGKLVSQVDCGDNFTVASTRDNEVYAWGKDYANSRGIIGANGNHCCNPRPVFGSLHNVSSIACCHWTTLLVAEKIVGVKCIGTNIKNKTDNVTISTDQVDSEICLQEDNITDLSQDETLPIWLQKELNFTVSQSIEIKDTGKQCLQSFNNHQTTNKQVSSDSIVNIESNNYPHSLENINIKENDFKIHNESTQAKLSFSDKVNSLKNYSIINDTSCYLKSDEKTNVELIERLKSENKKLNDLLKAKDEIIQRQSSTIDNLKLLLDNK